MLLKIHELQVLGRAAMLGLYIFLLQAGDQRIKPSWEFGRRWNVCTIALGPVYLHSQVRKLGQSRERYIVRRRRLPVAVPNPESISKGDP